MTLNTTQNRAVGKFLSPHERTSYVKPSDGWVVFLSAYEYDTILCSRVCVCQLVVHSCRALFLYWLRKQHPHRIICLLILFRCSKHSYSSDVLLQERHPDTRSSAHRRRARTVVVVQARARIVAIAVYDMCAHTCAHCLMGSHTHTHTHTTYVKVYVWGDGATRARAGFGAIKFQEIKPMKYGSRAK